MKKLRKVAPSNSLSSKQWTVTKFRDSMECSNFFLIVVYSALSSELETASVVGRVRPGRIFLKAAFQCSF